MKKYIVFLTAFVFILTGCIPMANQEVTDLKGEVAQMQIQFKELQQNHADLYARADTSFVTIDVLSASILDLQNKVSELNQTIEDLKVSAKKRDRDERVESQLPSDLYQNAYSDFSMGKYDLAYKGFQSFLDKYTNAELAHLEQFYMGECFYSRSMWDKAIEEYRKIEQTHKRSELVAAARLKIALCYELLGRKGEAMNVFSSIVKDFPQSSEAFTAKEKIRLFNNAQQRQQ